MRLSIKAAIRFTATDALGLAPRPPSLPNAPRTCNVEVSDFLEATGRPCTPRLMGHACGAPLPPCPTSSTLTFGPKCVQPTELSMGG